jgi:hypothetical protein
MSARSRRSLLGSIAVVALGAVVIGSGVAPAETGNAAPKITAAGVGAVKLGALHADLRAAGLVGPIKPGCELGGPTTRSARLKPPLEGLVNYTQTKPRRVVDISIRGGAKARGVGIGAKIPAIKAAFPKAKVSHATEQVFGITLVRIPPDGGGRLQFAVSTTTKRTTRIAVPRIAFCE